MHIYYQKLLGIPEYKVVEIISRTEKEMHIRTIQKKETNLGDVLKFL